MQPPSHDQGPRPGPAQTKGESLRIGTRSTPLALAQTEIVAAHLREWGYAVTIVQMTTQGDRSLGGSLTLERGMFTADLDRALLDDTIDLAVHSLKDLPVEATGPGQGTAIAAVLKRSHPGDVLLVREEDARRWHHDAWEAAARGTLQSSSPAYQSETPSLLPSTALSRLASHPAEAISAEQAFVILPAGTIVGTSSPRRQAATLALRPSLICCAVRGGVERRVERLAQGAVDALILAEAGLVRLLRSGPAPESWRRLSALRLSIPTWPAAPGQGALAVQVRAGSRWHADPAIAALDHLVTRRDVALERDVIAALGGGCQLPLGATVVHPTEPATDDAHLVIALAEEGWRERAEVAEAPAQRTRSFPVTQGSFPVTHGGEGNGAEHATSSDSCPLARWVEELLADLRPRPEGSELQGEIFPPRVVAAETWWAEATAVMPGAVSDRCDLLITSSVTAARRLAARLGAAAHSPRLVVALEVIDRIPFDAPWPVTALDFHGPRRTWPWVLLSSPTAATVLVERAQREPDWLRLPWCALGAGTARTLLALGIPANLIAASRNADHFATYALEHLPAEAPLLLPQSRRAGPRLAQRLRAAGRRVIAWDAYTVAPKPNLRWLGPPPPIVLFTSPSTAQAWIGAGLPSPALATWSMGESTTWELRQLGVEKVLEAPEPSPAGVRSLWETATRDSSHEP